MNWRWLLWDFADPDLPLTWRQRITASFRVLGYRTLPKRMWCARWIWLVWSLAFVVIAGVIVTVWLPIHRPIKGAAEVLLAISALLLFWSVYWCWLSIGFGLWCRREHLLRLRLDGYEVCMMCGYWLRGLDDDMTKCPECGAEREPMPEGAE